MGKRKCAKEPIDVNLLHVFDRKFKFIKALIST